MVYITEQIKAVEMGKSIPFTHSKNSNHYFDLQKESEKQLFLKSLFPKYKLSATHILKYKQCSKAFLYECFLKIKYPPNTAMLKGIIVHSLLDWVFKFYKEKENYPTPTQLEKQFYLIQQKEERKSGVLILEEEIEGLRKLIITYFEKQKEGWNTIAITEFYIFKHIWNSIPLTGFIDKIEFNGRNINIVDYKTGNIENALKKTEKGNDYWFQLVFYAVLMESFKPNWQVETIEMCIVAQGDDSTFVNSKTIVSEKEKAQVKAEIIEVYASISNLKFDGCKKEGCFWCNN